MNPSGAKQPKIVFRLSHMGDVALTTGVLAHWREKRSDTFIFLTRTDNAPLLKNHPAIRRVVELDDSELNGTAWVKRAKELSAEYRGHSLIDLHGTLRSHILSLLWKGSVRRYPKLSLIRRLYDRTHATCFRNTLEATNVPQRYCMAFGEQPPPPHKLVPRIYLSNAEKEYAAQHLLPITSKRPLTALHPYATHPAKQWPREHWLHLTRLLNEAEIDWIVIGRNATPLLNNRFDLTNKTNVRETCALLAQANLLITADSGPMHLSGGVDTPVLALFGPTAKAWGFYPAGKNDRILDKNLHCRPCSLHGSTPCTKKFECLAGIQPSEVFANIMEMLGQSAPLP